MYVYFSNANMVSVTNLETGEVTQFFSDDKRFDKALELVKVGDYAAVEAMNTKVAVQNFAAQAINYEGGRVSISIKNNVGKITIGFYETDLHDVLVNRITQLVADGFDAQPMVNFISNLYSNPSHTAVNELFLFLDAAQLPITEDGHFIAYKIVRGDYKDIYTATMDNSVGKVVEMPRFEVDDKRENTCSRGLHFCSRGYLDSYGTASKNTDRCLLVKINPADVVSIPSDYNNAKGRAWRYEVVGEVASGWRDTLPHEDYTNSSVVDSFGNECHTDYEWEDLDNRIDDSPFYFDGTVWQYKDPAVPAAYAGRKAVKEHLGVEYKDLDFYERNW